ncbi:MAG: hypothetical protein FWD61_02170 [Phycisphaerales bacterium]|nr:hypothetical protein [Phycisphaerales bacterium]
MATATHDPAVQHHESVHERICTQTPDGLSLGVLLMLAQAGESGITTPKHLATSADKLIQRSRFAQEVGATYLCVKVMQSDSHDSVLARLDTEYSNYFNVMKRVLDHRVKSSYLQYLVGWNIASTAFRSPLLERLVATGFQTPITLAENESPDFRLKSLLETCDRLSASEWSDLMGRLQATADMFCAERGWRTWNLQDEDAWVEAGKVVDTEQVEIALSVKNLWGTFEKLADFPIFPAEADEPLYLQLQALLRNFEIDFVLYHQPRLGDAPDQLRKAEAWGAGNAKIMNPFAWQVPSRNDHVLQDDSLRDSPLAAMTLVGCPDFKKKGRTWIFEALSVGKDDAEKQTIIGSTSEEHVVRWLRHRRSHVEEGHPVVPLTLLVAIHDASDYTRTTNEIINATFVRKPDASLFLPDGDQVLWYVDGNLVDWLEEVTGAARKAETVATTVSYVARFSMSNFGPFDDTIIKIYKLAGIPGYTCRLVTSVAQAHLSWYEKYQEQQGTLTLDLSNTPREFVSSVANSLLPLLYKWWPSI